jgi:hypothetical protein
VPEVKMVRQASKVAKEFIHNHATSKGSANYDHHSEALSTKASTASSVKQQHDHTAKQQQTIKH